MEDIRTSVDGREGKDDEKRLDIEEAPPELLAGVGEVLWKAQEDIKKMKEDILKESAHDEMAMLRLKGIIEKVETNIKRQTENMVKSVNDRCLTVATSNKTSKQPFPPPKRHGTTSTDLVPIQNKTTSLAGPGSLPPGQQFQNLQRLKAIINPLSKDSRKLLNEKYSVPLPALPAVKDKPEREVLESPKKPKANFQSLSADLTKGAIKDHNNPPPMSAEDAKQGMLFLIERNFIPPHAKITLDPSPVQLKQAKLHLHGTEQQNAETEKVDGGQFSKNSKSADRGLSRQSRVTFQDQVEEKIKNESKESNADLKFGNQEQARKASVASDAISEKALVPFPTPTFDDNSAVHKFVVQNGKTRTGTEDFSRFKDFYQSSWGSIISLLKRMEKFLTNYSIPIAIIDGDQFVDLALYFEGNLTPAKEDLMTCMLNGEDVNRFLMIPGRRFIAADGREEAAIRIQAAYRRYRGRVAYLLHRKRRWAAGLLALNWVMFCKLSVVKKQLKLVRESHLERYRLRAKIFKQSWEKIQSSKHVVIHIPSLGLCQQVRDFLPDISDRENRQIGRIFEVTDPNVEVVYVWPWRFHEDTAKYYKKLLDIVDGNTGSKSASERCHFVSPDAAHRFPSHNMCVSTLLKYSTSTLNRLKSLIKGKTAYIVPGLMHKDDLHVADVLEVPVLGCEPEIATLYSTKSGARRIFADAQVDKGPSETDIYSLHQLHESLAKLATKHLNIKRWMFKIDDEVSGRGSAYCDLTAHLQCYSWAEKEARRYGEKWNKKWAREGAYTKIFAEIPKILDEHAIVVDSSRFSSWKKFLSDFLSKGGVIEACPPSDSITSLSVDVLIDPCEKCKILSAADQISGKSPYQCLGYTFPQLSVDPTDLQSIVDEICSCCLNRGILGYLSMDFVTFIDPDSMAQRIWPVGLSLSYSNCLSSVKVLNHITKGSFEFKQNSYKVPVVVRQEPSPYRRRRKKAQETQMDTVAEAYRFAVMSSELFHEHLKSVQSSVLFQLCKSHGIGYDIKTKLGTVFTVIDQLKKDTFGILTIGESIQEALSSFALNLSLINRDISSNGKQPNTNVQDIIKNIQVILDMSAVNMDPKELVSPDPDNLESRQANHEQSKESERKSATPQLKRLPCPSPVTNPASPM